MKMEMQTSEEKEGLRDNGKEDRRDWKAIAIAVLVVVVILLIVILIAVAVTSKNECRELKKQKVAVNNSYMSCKNERYVIDPTLEDEGDIFRQLSLRELKSIESYMKQHFVIKPKGITALSNLSYIQNIELFIPNKKDALNYLDIGKVRPERRARVTIVQAPYNISYYIVEAMPNPSNHYLAKFNDRTNPLPYTPTPTEITNTPKMHEISKMCVKKMWKIFKATFEDLNDFNTPEEAFKGGLVYYDALSNVHVEGQRRTTMVWQYRPDEISNRHLNLLATITVMINTTSSVDDEWEIYQVFYNLEAYQDIQSVLDAYYNGKLKIVKVDALSKEDYEKTTLRRRGHQENYYSSMEPMLVSPNGPRFSVKGGKITYLDWQMNYIVQPSSGPALFDVRFQNKRIAFEISLQEASSEYSTGGSYMQAVNYLDSNWFLSITSPLTKGIDCPQHAVYLDVVVYLYFEAKKIKNAICIFEQNPSVPLRRHRHSISDDIYRYGGMNDASLVIRYITDIFNYDYIHDFVFHQNGVVEVRTSTTGYLLLQPYYKKNKDNYGHQVAPGYLGAIHDHYLMFKVDLDIAGTKNSFKTVDLTVKESKEPWDPFPTVKKFLTEQKRKTELNATIKYNFDTPKYYIVYNEEEKNRYGNVRGYRISIQNPVKQVYPDDHHGTIIMEWSKYQLAVSKFKETERYGSCMFNFYPQYKNPRCSFDARIRDDEGIENEDLVAWIPIGGPHFPSAEDYPLTPTIGNQFTFFLKPFNYFDEDASFNSANNVYFQKSKQSNVYETYDTPDEGPCGVPKRNMRSED